MKKILAGVLLSALCLPVSAGRAYSKTGANTYLLAHSSNPWVTMALEAVGLTPPTEYLKNLAATSAIEYAAPIMALTSLDLNPRTFGDKDYVSALKTYFHDGQLGDSSALNDDIFGLLALVSAGENVAQSPVSDIKTYLMNKQNSDGGWGFATSGSSDSNMTATAIVALKAAGVTSSDSALKNALDYLKTAQNSDGGITYDPLSQYGTSSDSSSTAWTIWALNALGIDPASWDKNGNNPTTYLNSNQTQDGFFAYQLGSNEDAFSPTTTAYAVLALNGKTLPLKILTAAPGFDFRIMGKDKEICAGKAPGPTALDVVKNAADLCSYTYHIQDTSFGPYLDRIADDQAVGMTGWMYLVNYDSPAVGASEYQLQNQDNLLWYYGDFGWFPTKINLSDQTVGSGQSATVSAQYYENGQWHPLNDAIITGTGVTTLTDSQGQANLTLSDGTYRLSVGKTGCIQSNVLTLKVGDAASQNNGVSLMANIVPGQIEGQTIAFTVDPASLDFGTIHPGQTVEKTVTIKNTGTTGFGISATVTGSAGLVDNLNLNHSPWRNYGLSIAEDQQTDLPVALALPAGYLGPTGSQTGMLTFWATAQ
jgi:hypothetical protein